MLHYGGAATWLRAGMHGSIPACQRRGAQVAQVVVQVVTRAQELRQIGQRTPQAGQQVPPQRVQLELL